MPTWELFAGGAEFFAWIGMIYFLASDTVARWYYSLAAWSDRMMAKYGD